MNLYIFTAGILSITLGLTHSVLGEMLIFKAQRCKIKIAPARRYTSHNRYRIIWASWHLVTIFGWLIGALLLKIATLKTELDIELKQFILISISVSMFLGSFLVYLGTRGRHLSWIILMLIALCSWLGK